MKELLRPSATDFDNEVSEGVPLRSLRAGESARVCRLTGNDDLVHRLRELGMRVGARVQMIQPGNPCIIRLEGQKFGFRADGAARVLVRLAGVAV